MSIFKELEKLNLRSDDCTVIEADQNGKCGWASLAFDLANYSDGIDMDDTERLKVDVLENAINWSISSSLGASDDRLLSALESANLRRMCIKLGPRPETMASVRDALKGMRDDEDFSMPLPFAAFASEVLKTTICIWEPAADGQNFELYRSDQHKGVFFHPDLTVPPIHLLYNSGKIGGSKMYLSRNEARGQSTTTVSAHQDFDRIVLKEKERTYFKGLLEKSWKNLTIPAPSPSSTAPIQPKPVSPQCSHVFLIGKKKGTQCQKRRSPLGGGRCSRHKRKTAGPAPPGKSSHGQRGQGAAAGVKHSGGEVDLEGSDMELDEEEELQWTVGEGNGKHTKTGKSEEAIERLAAKVPEAYRSVFRRVHELQKTVSVHRV